MREQRRRRSPHTSLWAMLDCVKDPEIPELSIWDIGILQDVAICNGKVTIIITPTYSGCPAMDLIREDITSALHKGGFENVEVTLQLSPAWTTDWMTAEAIQRMRGSGIAPPGDVTDSCKRACSVGEDSVVRALCPRCESSNTRLVSEFGSTACKSLFQCDDCGEPFDYFKKI